jgi:hypothetical protein
MIDYWNDPPEPDEPPECCGEPMDEFYGGIMLKCAHCDKQIIIEPEVYEPEPEIPDYVPELPEVGECPHGRKDGDCNACDIASDLVYDAARERR